MEPDRPFPRNEQQGLLCVALHMNSLESYRMLQERLTKLSGPGDGKTWRGKSRASQLWQGQQGALGGAALRLVVCGISSHWQRVLKKKIKQNSLSDIILLYRKLFRFEMVKLLRFQDPRCNVTPSVLVPWDLMFLCVLPHNAWGARGKENMHDALSASIFFSWLILEDPVQRSTIHCRIFWRMRGHCCFSLPPHSHSWSCSAHSLCLEWHCLPSSVHITPTFQTLAQSSPFPYKANLNPFLLKQLIVLSGIPSKTC